MTQKLLKLGYQNVYDFGGVIDWPYELVFWGSIYDFRISRFSQCKRIRTLQA